MDRVDGTAPAPGAASLDRLLAEARVLVVAGPGGVGKTTIGAALGLRAAVEHGRRVMVVTVDPARRLAEALGVARLTEEPVLVPVGEGSGRLWVLMVDMAKSWDELVLHHAPEPGIGERLLANDLYRTLTRRFVQSHDYIALDHLVTLAEEDRYDLVVVDTPPSDHAIDLVDAPERMMEFFESRLLRWLTVGVGSAGSARLMAAPARPFLMVAERLLGRDFLGQITEFFSLFVELRPAFVERARLVRQRLREPTTGYVVVTTTEEPVAAAAQQLIETLAERELMTGLILANRVPPTIVDPATPVAPAPGVDGEDDRLVRPLPPVDAARFAPIEDPGLADAVRRLHELSAAARLPRSAGADVPVIAVPWSDEDLSELDTLIRLLAPRPLADPIGG